MINLVINNTTTVPELKPQPLFHTWSELGLKSKMTGSDGSFMLLKLQDQLCRSYNMGFIIWRVTFCRCEIVHSTCILCIRLMVAKSSAFLKLKIRQKRISLQWNENLFESQAWPILDFDSDTLAFIKPLLLKNSSNAIWWLFLLPLRDLLRNGFPETAYNHSVRNIVVFILQ